MAEVYFTLVIEGIRKVNTIPLPIKLEVCKKLIESQNTSDDIRIEAQEYIDSHY